MYVDCCVINKRFLHFEKRERLNYNEYYNEYNLFKLHIKYRTEIVLCRSSVLLFIIKHVRVKLLCSLN